MTLRRWNRSFPRPADVREIEQLNRQHDNRGAARDSNAIRHCARCDHNGFVLVQRNTLAFCAHDNERLSLPPTEWTEVIP